MAEIEMTETEDYAKNVFPRLTITGDGVITWQGASAASNYLFDTRVLGDTNPRFRISADGRIEWGTGAVEVDTNMSRSSTASIMFNSNAYFNWGSATFGGGISSYVSINSKLDTDTHFRFNILRYGQLEWSSGVAIFDCILSRRNANILNTPDRFEVGTLGVANSAAGTTPGSCQNKIEVFDAAGNSLGFIAVYDSIT